MDGFTLGSGVRWRQLPPFSRVPPEGTGTSSHLLLFFVHLLSMFCHTASHDDIIHVTAGSQSAVPESRRDKQVLEKEGGHALGDHPETAAAGGERVRAMAPPLLASWMQWPRAQLTQPGLALCCGLVHVCPPAVTDSHGSVATDHEAHGHGTDGGAHAEGAHHDSSHGGHHNIFTAGSFLDSLEVRSVRHVTSRGDEMAAGAMIQDMPHCLMMAGWVQVSAFMVVVIIISLLLEVGFHSLDHAVDKSTRRLIQQVR